MTRLNIMNQYHLWLTSLVCDEYHQRYFQALLETLNETEFTWVVPNDMNRAADGIDLRSRFAEEHNIDYREIRDALNRQCSVLEMMVGLACRCEDSIMGDEDFGDRTQQWFWTMIENLDLDIMDDDHYNDYIVHRNIRVFLDRTYKRDGQGGLFVVPHCKKDLRKIEIWYQMCWYLNTITE